MSKQFHPVAAATREAAQRVRPRPEGIHAPRSSRTVVPVQVTKALIPRMTRFLDQLLRAAEGRGFVVGADHTHRQGHGPRPAIVVRGAQITFNVTEGMTRTEHPPDADDRGHIARGHDYLVRRYDNVPNGQLRLAITNQYGGRTRWTDRKNAALEELVEGILDGMDAHARREELRDAERKVEREQHRRDALRAHEEAIVRLREATWIAALDDQVAAWVQADRIRHYCQAVDDHLARTHVGRPGDCESTEEWLRWARQHADRMDPASTRPTAPSDPEATPAALAPYMRGYSPYDVIVGPR